MLIAPSLIIYCGTDVIIHSGYRAGYLLQAIYAMMSLMTWTGEPSCYRILSEKLFGLSCEGNPGITSALGDWLTDTHILSPSSCVMQDSARAWPKLVTPLF